MTATELYEIVKDVPREALVGMHHEGAFGWFNLEGGAWIPPNVAELAFIGSMLKWLTGNSDDAAVTMWAVSDGWQVVIGGITQPGSCKPSAPTLIEAIAAACKVVGVKPG